MNPEEILLDSDNDGNDDGALSQRPTGTDTASVPTETGSGAAVIAATDASATANDDDDIAAQMGFSSFGPQEHGTSSRPSKRARYLHDGSSQTLPASIPSAPSSAHTASGAGRGAWGRGSTRLRDATISPGHSAHTLSSPRVPDVPALRDVYADPETVAEVRDEDTMAVDASATRNAGRRQRAPQSAPTASTDAAGDPVYWDSSFVEDPWEGMTPQRLQPLSRR